MTLIYDFDIFDLAPPNAGPDAETTGFLARLGLLARKSATTAELGPNRVALFRSPATADALRAAPDDLRTYFLAAGFGLNTYSSGAPRLRYPAEDEEARLDLILRLTALAPKYRLPTAAEYPEGSDVFRLGGFLADLSEARPLPAARQATQDGSVAGFETAPSAPARKFWHSRYLRAALLVFAVLVLMQASGSIDAFALASL